MKLVIRYKNIYLYKLIYFFILFTLLHPFSIETVLHIICICGVIILYSQYEWAWRECRIHAWHFQLT